MLTSEKKRLRPYAVVCLLLLGSAALRAQTYNPSVCCTVSNKAYGAAQAVPTDGRSMFYDATNFVMRDYNGTTEVLSYLNLAKYRTGHFPVYVHSGGSLQPNGVWLGGSTLVYWFKDSTGNTNLVRWYTDSTGTPGGPFFAVANNLSEGNAGLIKGNLALDLVNNTSDAQKNAATVSLTNHTIDGSLNTLLHIPNSALTNSSIGLTITATPASDVSVTTTPAALGSSLVVNLPSSGTSARGVLTSTDWNAFHAKIDSVRVSNDSVYNCANGTCTLQSVIVGGGSVNSVNGTNASLLFSPSTGNVLGQVNPAYSFNWTGQHTFLSFAPIFSTLTTSGGVFYGSGTGQLLQSAAGTTGQILQSNGGTAPTFFTPNSGTVIGWLGYTPLTNVLGSAHIFVGNGSNVATDVALSGDGTLSNTGVLTITKRDSLFGVLDNVAGQNRTVDFAGTYSFTLNNIFNGFIFGDSSASSTGTSVLAVHKIDNSTQLTTSYRTGPRAGVRSSWNLGNVYGQLYASPDGSLNEQYIRAYKDSMVELLTGTYFIRGLSTTADSGNWKPLAINTTTGEKRQLTLWPNTGGTITGAGNFSPLFTTGVSGSTITFTALTAAANTAFGNFTGSSAAAAFGKVPIAALATSTNNTLIGFNGSGNPVNITAGTNITISGGVISAAGGGADSAVLPGFGLAKTVSSTTIYLSIDTINSYFLLNPVTGLNNKIVSDGNSNSIGFNNPGGIANSYPRVSWRELDSSLAVYTNTNLGVSGQTTQQMITNAPTVVDTAFDGTKTKNYLYAWEMENDAAINTGLSSLQLKTNMNTYYSARNGVGWITIGATALPRTALTGTDSLLKARLDSANLALVNNHTSAYLIDFRGNPWLNNNRSRAGFGSDWIHMNPSGTLTMADSFSNVVRRDQGQPLLPTPLRYVSWGGNRPDRNMIIGPLNGYGISLAANGVPQFDLTQYNKVSIVNYPQAEATNAPNVAFDVRPSFYNPNNFTGVINADVRINQESQWINSNNNNLKVAFFNPGSNIQNMGFGIDVFANLIPGQSTVFFNSAFGGRALQASTIGSFNTMIGSFSSDTHITDNNVFVNAGLAVGTVGAANTWIGARGTISNAVANSITMGYSNTTSASYAVSIGTTISSTGASTHAGGGSMIIGSNNTDAGFRAIIIANNEANNYGTAPTADGQIIIGDVYHAAGYKAMDYMTLFGNQALNSTIQAAFSTKTLTIAGVAGGGSNTNLAASANEFDILGAVATGNAAGGDVVFGTSVKGASGTTRQSIQKVLRIGADQTVDIGEPATKPFGTNINTTMGVNKDSVTHMAAASGVELMVQDTTTQIGKVKRIGFLTGSGTLDFPSTLTLQSSDLTITVTGAAVGDVVQLGVDAGSVLSNSCYTAWVSATNTVTVRFNNYSVGAQDPASGTFKIIIIK